MADRSDAMATTPGLRIIRTTDGDATVLILIGELDVSSASTLRTELEAVAGSTREVVLEMAEVSFLDSSGLGTIVGAQRTLGNDFCQLTIRNPSRSVRHVLEISGVAAGIHISETGVPSTCLY